MRIIYYYQTFVGMSSLLQSKKNLLLISTFLLFILDIILIQKVTKLLYIHLNNCPPDDPKFDYLERNGGEATKKGIRCINDKGGWWWL